MSLNFRRFRSAVVTASAAAIAATAALVPTASAATLTPQQVAGNAPQSVVSDLEVTPAVADRTWFQKFGNDPRVLKLQATSPAMNGRVVPLAVIPAGEPGRPTIYLLNGAGGAEQQQDWLTMSQLVDFYADKKVNVVVPQAGAFSYYTDWISEPNGAYLKGPQKWETFLTKELPGPLEARLGANNKRAIAGMSMSAGSAFSLAQHNQGFYDAVGSFAGCGLTAYPLQYEFVRVTVNRGGAQPEQMWGPMGSDTNRWNDAFMNAEQLRGTELYISSASGLAAEQDLPGYYIQRGYDPLVSTIGSAQLIIEGGIIEAAVNNCTHMMKAQLDKKGIPADYNFRNTGTHSWPGWREDIEKSWGTFWRAFYAK
ncbi:esterase [Corynebacterium phocae]|uniref:Acyl-CoA:diacylglycerol acyltransferase n=1 Tax=Corynebacterium phocae TaxID=161895 RepID=A0A1L7D0U8_9CORY|nr:alpha/beta hydrolase family protein [Corynebacterium phocae]APT91776.1 esterase [Corynebacterium phocae]KAA8728548.1 esterase family protein [Corynebacterium phocae]